MDGFDKRTSVIVLASATMGMSGAQLANPRHEAALVAARDDHKRISRADFEAALNRILLGTAETGNGEVRRAGAAAGTEAGSIPAFDAISQYSSMGFVGGRNAGANFVLDQRIS